MASEIKPITNRENLPTLLIGGYLINLSGVAKRIYSDSGLPIMFYQERQELTDGSLYRNNWSGLRNFIGINHPQNTSDRNDISELVQKEGFDYRIEIRERNANEDERYGTHEEDNSSIHVYRFRIMPPFSENLVGHTHGELEGDFSRAVLSHLVRRYFLFRNDSNLISSSPPMRQTLDDYFTGGELR